MTIEEGIYTEDGRINVNVAKAKLDELTVKEQPEEVIEKVVEEPEKVIEEKVIQDDDFKTKYETILPEFETYKKKVTEDLPKFVSENENLRKELETAKQTNIDDPELYRLGVIKKQKPDDYKTYFKLLNNELSDTELIKAKVLAENPALKTMEKQDVDDFIAHKFGLDIEVPSPLDPELASEEEVNQRNKEIEKANKLKRINETALKSEAQNYAEVLKAEFSKIEAPTARDPEAQKAQIEEAQGKAKQYFATPVEKLAETIVKIPVFAYMEVKEGEQPQAEIQFEVSKEEQAQVAKEALELLSSNLMQPTEETLKVAKFYMTHKLIERNQHKINYMLMEHARSMTEEKWIERSHNPSALAKNRVQPKTELNKIQEHNQQTKEKYFEKVIVR